MSTKPVAAQSAMNRGSLLSIAICVLLMLEGCSAPHESSEGEAAPDVQAKLVFDSRSEGYELQLMNNSDDFVCLNERQFDSTRGWIKLFDSENRRVRQSTYSDGRSDLQNDFDFAPAYYILRPRQRRDFSIDIRNFQTSVGLYRFSMAMSFYSCSDIFKTGAFQDQQSPLGYSMNVEGEIQVDK